MIPLIIVVPVPWHERRRKADAPVTALPLQADGELARTVSGETRAACAPNRSSEEVVSAVAAAIDGFGFEHGVNVHEEKKECEGKC
jgi:hypothetical protein